MLHAITMLSVCTAAAGDSLAALYETGRTWVEFQAAARSRKEEWTGNYERGEPRPDLVERAKSAGGRWRILVVAEDWCGDSANSLPYLARLVEAVPTLELRITNSTIGKWVMARYPMHDGRPGTPTILVLDEQGAPVGCLSGYPRALVTWLKEHAGESDLHTRKKQWYDDDRGRSVTTDVVEIMESASRGTPQCRAGGS